VKRQLILSLPVVLAAGDAAERWVLLAGGNKQGLAGEEPLRNLELGSNPVEQSTSYLAYGALVEGGVDIYWGSWVATSLGVNMTLLMYKELDGLAVTLDSSVWAGVSVAS
jgi:hypothetical protein